VLLLFAPEVRESVLIFLPDGIAHVEAAPQEPPAVPVRTGGRGVESLTSRLQSRIPLQPYLIISTTDNTFRLMAGQMVIREGVASTGSYIRLETERGDRWTFHTPRGQFRIQGKVKNPVWIRPDWSFVEEGRPVPPANAPERYERGVLGDFALSIGNGYLIHGTLYQRLLGLPVTHGCVRLGDDDLEAVYGALDIGSSVYIY
jgi:L,D-transpeptidase YbiS